jgi:hypothetical protein
VWSKRGASEEPKVAGICGASEIRIDASTAAAVIIRASLFMILTGGVFVSEIAVLLCGCRCNLDDLLPTTTGYFGLSRRAQGPLFLLCRRIRAFFLACWIETGNQHVTNALGTTRLAVIELTEEGPIID